MTRREEYAAIWDTIPTNDTAIDIPEGATEEGAQQNRVLPENLTPEQAREILTNVHQRATD